MAERAARGGALLVGVAFLALGLLWATFVPPFEKPDEINHFAYVAFVAREGRLPVQTRERDLLLEPETQQPPAYYAATGVLLRLAEAAGLPPTDLSAWAARVRTLDPRTAPVGAAFFSQWGIGRDPGETYPLDLTFIRLLTVLAGLATVWFTWRVARTMVPQDPWLAVAAAALVAFLPQVAFASSAASNDPLAWAVAAAYLLVLLSMAGRRNAALARTYLLLGVLLGLAVLTKATLYALVPLTLLARPRGAPLREWLRGLGLWASAALVCCGWWFARNVVLYGAALPRQEAIDPARYGWNVAPRSILAVLASPGFWTPLWQSSVGRFGFMNILLPPFVNRAAFVIGVLLLAAFAARLLALWQSRSGAGSQQALWSWLVVGALPVFALALVVQYNTTVSQPQGRYLFAALPSVAAVAAAGADRLPLAGPLARGRKWPLPGWAPGPGAALLMGVAAALLAVNLWALFGVVVPAYGAAAWSFWAGH